MFMHFVAIFCTLPHLERAEREQGLPTADFLHSFAKFTLEKVGRHTKSSFTVTEMSRHSNKVFVFHWIIRIGVSGLLEGLHGHLERTIRCDDL